MEGKTLSHFKILEKIGEGGMGVIYKAEDVNLGRTVALKILPPKLVSDEDRRHKFIQEARTAAAVTHPHIATIHEVDEDNGTTFIAMELVEGESLREHLGGSALPVKEAVRLAEEIAEAVGAAHQAGIIHRDLKPDNVIVGKDGHAKVLDFGLAQLLEKDETPIGDAGDKTMAGDSNIFGTPAYMSPEQARGKPLDTRSDIFSFGCTLHEMVTGAAPFKGATASDTISQLLNREAVPAASINPDIPDGLQWVLNKCLDKDPSQRYQDARDLAVDLRHIAADSGSQATAAARAARTGVFAPPAKPVPMWKRPAFIIPAVFALIAAFLAPRLFQGDGVKLSKGSENSVAVFSFENLKNPEDPDRLGQILQELVITDLSGMDPVKVLSSQRIHDVQKQMGMNDETVDKDRTTEVAIRAGAGRMLTGTLSQLGEKWILAAQLVDVETGEVVQSKRIDGDDLYTMVDALTADLQSDLRISMPTETSTASASVKDKTTHSLEAYKHYLSGVDKLNNDLFSGAVEDLSKAIEIDPDFGQAYYKLAMAMWWPSDNVRAAREPLQTMMSRELFTSGKEKHMAEGLMALMQQKFDEAHGIFNQLTMDYPDEKEAWYGLGESQFHAFGGGREEEALVAFNRAVALDPDFRLPYQHIMDVYYNLKLRDDALARATELLEKDPGDANWHRMHVLAVALQEDPKALEEAIDQALVYNTDSEEKKELYKSLAAKMNVLGNRKQGIEYYQMAAAAAPDDVQLQRIIINQLLADRRLEDYSAAILKGLAENPNHPAYQGQARDIFRRRGRWDLATAMAESISAARPDDPEAARQWAWHAVQMTDESKRSRSMALVEKLHKSPDERRALYGQLSGAYQSMGDHVSRLENIQKQVDLTSEPDADLCMSMSWANFDLGNLEEARTWQAKGEAQNPRNGGVLAAGCIMNITAGDTEAALAYAERVSEIAPRSNFYYAMRGMTLLAAARIDEAAAIIDEALVELPTKNDRYEVLTQGAGFGMASQGEWERAEALFRKAVEIDPSQEALGGLAVCLAHRGDLDAAEREIRRGLKRVPHSRDLHLGLAMVHLERGDGAEAVEVVLPISEAGPHRAQNFMVLGWSYSQQGRFDEARRWAEKAHGMAPTREHRDLLAWVLVAGNLDIDRGADVALAAVNAPPAFMDIGQTFGSRAPAEESLALAAMKREQYAEAVNWFEKAAEVNPNRSSIQEGLAEARTLTTGAP